MWLKRSTPQNIVIGGAAGAFPPMIGWAAVTGTVSARERRPLPHHLPVDAAAFLGAGALQARRLRRAGIPMMPNVAGEASTKRQIFVYSLLVAAVGVAALAARLSPAPVYGVVAAALGAAFVWLRLAACCRMPDGDRDDGARPRRCSAIRCSISSRIFAALLVDSCRQRVCRLGLDRWSRSRPSTLTEAQKKARRRRSIAHRRSRWPRWS